MSLFVIIIIIVIAVANAIMPGIIIIVYVAYIYTHHFLYLSSCMIIRYTFNLSFYKYIFIKKINNLSLQYIFLIVTTNINIRIIIKKTRKND